MKFKLSTNFLNTNLINSISDRGSAEECQCETRLVFGQKQRELIGTRQRVVSGGDLEAIRI